MIHLVDRYGILGDHGQDLCRKIRCGKAKWFKNVEDALLVAHDLIPSMKPRQFDGQAVVAATLFVRGLSQAQAALLLCANGMTNETRIVLRSLIELVVYLRAIHTSKWLMWHYVKQHDRERIRMAGKVSRSDFLQRKLPEFDPAAERTRIREELGGAKNGPSLELYSEAAGMKEVYYTAYTVFCGAVHTGAQDLHSHLDAVTPEELKEIRYGVSDEGIDSLLVTLAELILLSMEPVIDRFSIEEPPELESVCEEHKRLGRESTEQNQEHKYEFDNHNTAEN